MSIVVGMGIVGVLVLIASALFIWTVASSTRVRGVDPDWLGSFSVATYRPMERLLSEDDIRFLKSQPGYEPNMEKALRSDRRKIFRAYLRSLGRDFNRLHLALRLVVLHSPEDRPDLATALIKQKLLFFAGLVAIHARLQLYGLGIGTVDVRDLLASLDTMRSELEMLVPVPAQPSA